MFLTGDSLSPAMTAGEERMETPGDVAVMLRLAELGWGSKRIAGELGCSRTTVKRYLRQGGWASYRGRGRPSALAGLEGWLAERFRQHRGNADVVRQELAREHGVRVSLRTVERAVADLRRDLLAEARACVRFETPPGRQLQIDVGSTWVPIAGEWIRVYLFVATLGYSRRGFVAAFRHERQSAWFEGLEGAFRHFGGVPREVLLRQRQAARRSPRCGDARGRVQRAAARLCALLGIPAACLRALPGPHQGQGRERRRLRQEERDRRPPLRLLGGAGSTPCLVDARGCRYWVGGATNSGRARSGVVGVLRGHARAALVAKAAHQIMTTAAIVASGTKQRRSSGASA